MGFRCGREMFRRHCLRETVDSGDMQALARGLIASWPNIGAIMPIADWVAEHDSDMGPVFLAFYHMSQEFDCKYMTGLSRSAVLAAHARVAALAPDLSPGQFARGGMLGVVDSGGVWKPEGLNMVIHCGFTDRRFPYETESFLRPSQPYGEWNAQVTYHGDHPGHEPVGKFEIRPQHSSGELADRMKKEGPPGDVAALVLTNFVVISVLSAMNTCRELAATKNPNHRDNMQEMVAWDGRQWQTVITREDYYDTDRFSVMVGYYRRWGFDSSYDRPNPNTLMVRLPPNFLDTARRGRGGLTMPMVDLIQRRVYAPWTSKTIWLDLDLGRAGDADTYARLARLLNLPDKLPTFNQVMDINGL